MRCGVVRGYNEYTMETEFLPKYWCAPLRSLKAQCFTLLAETLGLHGGCIIKRRRARCVRNSVCRLAVSVVTQGGEAGPVIMLAMPEDEEEVVLLLLILLLLFLPCRRWS